LEETFTSCWDGEVQKFGGSLWTGRKALESLFLRWKKKRQNNIVEKKDIY